MATVIDALVVSLGLDSKGYKKGTDDAIKQQKKFSDTVKRDDKERFSLEKKAADARTRHHKLFMQQTKQTADSFRHIRNELLTTIGVFAGGAGLLMFGKNAIVGAANISVLSQITGVQARTIAGLQGALETLGGSAGSANSLLSSTAQSISEFKATGSTGGILAAFQQFGGKLSSADLKSPYALLLDFSNVLHHYIKTNPHGISGAMAIAARAGISGPAFDLLGYHNMAAMVEQQARLAGINARNAAAAQRFRAAMVNLGHAFAGVGREIAFALMKPLMQLATWMQSNMPQIKADVSAFILKAEKLAPVIQKVVNEMGGWKTILEGLIIAKAASFLMKLVKPLRALAAIAGDPVVAALAVIAAFLYSVSLIYTHWSTAKKALSNGSLKNFEGGAQGTTDTFSQAMDFYLGGLKRLFFGGSVNTPNGSLHHGSVHNNTSTITVNGMSVNATQEQMKRFYEGMSPLFPIPVPQANFGMQ